MGMESSPSSDQEIILDRESFLKRAQLQRSVMKMFLGNEMEDEAKKTRWVNQYGPAFNVVFEKKFTANPLFLNDVAEGSSDFDAISREITEELKLKYIYR